MCYNAPIRYLCTNPSGTKFPCKHSYERMIIKGHIRQFFSTSGKGYFLSEQTLQSKKHDNGRLSLDTVNRKCKYFYFYFLDKHFGFMHMKLRTWFPFLIQVYINGRKMIKHIFDENGISYQMYDNSFIEISGIPKAQELADRFDSKSLCRQLDFFAHKVNPYLDTIEKNFHQG